MWPRRQQLCMFSHHHALSLGLRPTGTSPGKHTCWETQQMGTFHDEGKYCVCTQPACARVIVRRSLRCALEAAASDTALRHADPESQLLPGGQSFSSVAAGVLGSDGLAAPMGCREVLRFDAGTIAFPASGVGFRVLFPHFKRRTESERWRARALSATEALIGGQPDSRC